MSDNINARDLLSRAEDQLAREHIDLNEWRHDVRECRDPYTREALAETARALDVKRAFLDKLYDLLEEMENE